MRQLHDDAVDLGVAVQAAEGGEQLALGHVGGQVDLLERMPTSAHALCLEPT